MKRKKNIIDDLALQMRLNDKSDEDIIALISNNVQDLEMGDRTGATLLWHSVLCKRRNVAEYLLEHEANINTQDENGFSALHLAVQEKSIGMVTHLLKNGADVNIRDKFGNTPIIRTDLSTPLELLRILLVNGADVDIKNHYGVSCRDKFVAYPDRIGLFNEYSKI